MVVFAVSFLLMYWGIKQIYSMLKPKINNITEQEGKLDSLEKRVELLERKLDEK